MPRSTAVHGTVRAAQGGSTCRAAWLDISSSRWRVRVATWVGKNGGWAGFGRLGVGEENGPAWEGKGSGPRDKKVEGKELGQGRRKGSPRNSYISVDEKSVLGRWCRVCVGAN